MRKELILSVLVVLICGMTRPMQALANTEPNIPSDTMSPPGCLKYSPNTVTLEGYLVGILYPSYAEETPPIPPRGEVLLWLGKPISICGASNKTAAMYPPYENVVRISLMVLSPKDYHYVMNRWRKDRIRITGTLDTVQSGWLSPPLTMGINRFCWSKFSEEINSADQTKLQFKCVSWKAFLKQMPRSIDWSLP